MGDLDRVLRNAERQQRNLAVCEEQLGLVEDALSQVETYGLEEGGFDATFIESLQVQLTTRIAEYESGATSYITQLSDNQMGALANVEDLIEKLIDRSGGH